MSTKKTLETDFCVIGGGSGGLSFAAGAVQMGASVVLLESKKMGGDCLNYGCVPSKALISASKIVKTALKNDFGVSVPDKKIDFKKVHQHVHDVIAEIAPHDSVERFEKLGVKVILEEGKFKNAYSVETEQYVIKAKRFIIATGSSAFIPEIDGLSSIPYYTNENIFDLKELPKNLVVIGGGPIGIELSQAFSRLGSKVTVLEAFQVLPKDDPIFSEKLKNILKEEGVDIHEHVLIEKCAKSGKSIKINYQTKDGKSETLTASHVLVATGRQPNIKTLNLDAGLIKYTEKGIIVNRLLQTSNKKVYAIGDCTGGYQFTHVAGYEAGIAIRNTIFGLRAKAQMKVIPWVTYTDPELAHVGYSEEKLIKDRIKHKVLYMDFSENDRAQTEKRTEGMIKVLASPRGHVLGVTIMNPNAGELIYPWVIAMQNGLKIDAIAHSMAPYPTLNDINKRIAGSFYKEKIFGPQMQKIVQFIMRWFR